MLCSPCTLFLLMLFAARQIWGSGPGGSPYAASYRSRLSRATRQSGESIWPLRVELPASKEQSCNEAPIG
jgi:hypothetical protein